MKKKKKRRKKAIPDKKVVFDKNAFIGLGIIFLLTILSFSPIFNADFVNWDDTVNILDNENVWNLTWDNIKAIFTEHVIGNYNPLTILSFAIEYHFVGENAFLFHLDNLLLHLFNIVLIFALGKRLKLGLYPSLFFAALFAIQPMRVESVAWITERKDVLFAAFYFGAIHKYLDYKIKKSKSAYILSIFLMILSCLSKIQAVSLPLSLLLIDMYRYKNMHWGKWIKEKIPYFIISIIMGLIGVYFLRLQGSLMNSGDVTSFMERMILGFYGIGVYLIKSIYPYEMVAIYPYSHDLHSYHYIFGVLGLLSFVGMIYLWFTRRRVLKFGLYFFLVNVIFLLQFVGAGQGLTADRFTYVPYVGCFFIIAYFWNKAREKNLWFSGKTWSVLAVIALLGYSYMTFRQTQVWENSETLWKHQLKFYDRIPLPYANLANYLRDHGRYEEAMKNYNQSLDLVPRRALTRNSRGRLYFMLGKYEKALQDYNIALEEDPHNAEYLSNKGATLGYLKRFELSLQYFNMSIKNNSDYITAYTNRAYTHFQLGHYSQAYEDFLVTLKNTGPSGQLYSMMARCSFSIGQNNRALQEINNAIRLDNNPNFLVIKALILDVLGQANKARQILQQAENRGANVKPQIKQRIFTR